jgi:hypothetical protein
MITTLASHRTIRAGQNAELYAANTFRKSVSEKGIIMNNYIQLYMSAVI